MLLHTSAASLTLLALAILSDAALGAPGECRFIQSRKERNACYEREAATKAAAQQKSGSARTSETIDQLKVENDNLNRRLQGICRGC
jgi:hypothetical protein